MAVVSCFLPSFLLQINGSPSIPALKQTTRFPYMQKKIGKQKGEIANVRNENKKQDAGRDGLLKIKTKKTFFLSSFRLSNTARGMFVGDTSSSDDGVGKGRAVSSKIVRSSSTTCRGCHSRYRRSFELSLTYCSYCRMLVMS